jgi:hypothetical protein
VDVLRSRQVLAEALLRAGQTQAGLALAVSSLQSGIEAWGPQAPLTASLRDSLGRAYLQTGEAVRAEALFREHVALAQQLPHRPDWYVPQLQVSVAEALIAQQRELEGRQLLQDAFDVLSRTLGSGNHRTQVAQNDLLRLH